MSIAAAPHLSPGTLVTISKPDSSFSDCEAVIKDKLPEEDWYNVWIVRHRHNPYYSEPSYPLEFRSSELRVIHPLERLARITDGSRLLSLSGRDVQVVRDTRGFKKRIPTPWEPEGASHVPILAVEPVTELYIRYAPLCGTFSTLVGMQQYPSPQPSCLRCQHALSHGTWREP